MFDERRGIIEREKDSEKYIAKRIWQKVNYLVGSRYRCGSQREKGLSESLVCGVAVELGERKRETRGVSATTTMHSRNAI